MRIDVNENTLEKVKNRISEKTGIPVDLLNGETIEENIVQAKTLIAMKQKSEDERPKTASEEFSAWMKKQYGFGNPDENKDVLSTLESDIMAEFVFGYTNGKDAEEVDHSNFSDGRSVRDQFRSWVQKTW